MRRILCMLCLLLLAVPAVAQTAPPTMPPALARLMEPPEFSAGHTLALGVGLFAGAVVGSVLIAGGGIAAAIGGVAGLATGHWVWTQHGEKSD